MSRNWTVKVNIKNCINLYTNTCIHNFYIKIRQKCTESKMLLITTFQFFCVTKSCKKFVTNVYFFEAVFFFFTESRGLCRSILWLTRLSKGFVPPGARPARWHRFMLYCAIPCIWYTPLAFMPSCILSLSFTKSGGLFFSLQLLKSWIILITLLPLHHISCTILSAIQ